MEVKVDKRVELNASLAAGWSVLRDIRAVAACMPGAQITEQIDPSHFKGTVTSRVGPATLRFAGLIEVLEMDEKKHEMRLLGKAVDQTGSSASMTLTASIAPGSDPGQSTLVGNAAISVSGKLAQFSGRLIGPASEVILAQFSENFRAAVETVAQAADGSGAQEQAKPPIQATELKASDLAWSMLKRWLKRLFRSGTN